LENSTATTIRSMQEKAAAEITSIANAARYSVLVRMRAAMTCG
jgi:hypothetical protein